jgi:hypothetical protein
VCNRRRRKRREEVEVKGKMLTEASKRYCHMSQSADSAYHRLCHFAYWTAGRARHSKRHLFDQNGYSINLSDIPDNLACGQASGCFYGECQISAVILNPAAADVLPYCGPRAFLGCLVHKGVLEGAGSLGQS